MEFRDALRIVVEDTVTEHGEVATVADAVDLARTLEIEDVQATADDPDLVAAYRMVLDASPEQIEQALPTVDPITPVTAETPQEELTRFAGQLDLTDDPTSADDTADDTGDDTGDEAQTEREHPDRSVATEPDPAELERIRAAVADLPDGPITDDTLAQVGVTMEEFDRLVDADMDAQAEEWRADWRAEQEFQAWWRAGADDSGADDSGDAAEDSHATTERDTDAGSVEESMARTDQTLRACDAALHQLDQQTADKERAERERAERVARWQADQATQQHTDDADHGRDLS